MDNYFIDYKEFTELCHKLLNMIKKRGEKYDAVLCPLKGGFYLSHFISQHLDIPMHYIEISCYSGRGDGEFYIGYKPELPLGRILICDDIYDTGNTVNWIRAIFPSVKFDVLCLASKDEGADICYGVYVGKGRWVDFFWEML